MFRNAQIDDKVWSFSNGWGKIIQIDKNSNLPINVEFENSVELRFTKEGKLYPFDENPSLFWSEIKFKVPSKPFNLEGELIELKKMKKNFEIKSENCFLIWDNINKRITFNSCYYSQYPKIDYFKAKDIKNFIEKIQNKKIHKEEFFAVYEKVFG